MKVIAFQRAFISLREGDVVPVKSLFRTFAARLLERNITVPISSCVHFCGFRYGRGEFNPYENYVRDYAGGKIGIARHRFEEFLRHYRPVSLGDALGATLSRPYRLWDFPWERASVGRENFFTGWYDDPRNIPDILTHFSPAGIPRSRILQEFEWLESVHRSIRERGYQPSIPGKHVFARKLVMPNQETFYLILDGNHRLSALSALSCRTVKLTYRTRMSVFARDAAAWPKVKNGSYTMPDALQVLLAYGAGNQRPRTTETPALITEE